MLGPLFESLAGLKANTILKSLVVDASVDQVPGKPCGPETQLSKADTVL